MSHNSLLTFIDLHSGKAVEGDRVGPLVLAIGNFDGVHRGHKCLIERAIRTAEEMKDSGNTASGGVFCFLPSPGDLLMKSPPPHICSHEKKLELFAACGARYAVVGDFSVLKDMEAEDFVALLKERCGCIALVCGFNFRFGKGGCGNAELLKRFFGEKLFVTDAVTSNDGMPISSSRIRSLVESGDIEKANGLLGHPFSVSGKVLHGKELGRRLGLPTVNQNFDENLLIPRSGVYITSVIIRGERYMAVSNIGRRPTVETDGKINCETHLLDFEGDLYGVDITVEFYARSRDEKKFSCEEELRRAICNDVLSVRKYFEQI